MPSKTQQTKAPVKQEQETPVQTQDKGTVLPSGNTRRDF